MIIYNRDFSSSSFVLSELVSIGPVFPPEFSVSLGAEFHEQIFVLRRLLFGCAQNVGKAWRG